MAVIDRQNGPDASIKHDFLVSAVGFGGVSFSGLLLFGFVVVLWAVFLGELLCLFGVVVVVYGLGAFFSIRRVLPTFTGCGKRQTRHHLFTECKAWKLQIWKLWKEVGKAHGWKHPRAPSGRGLWREMSTEAVLAFLGSTRVGCISTRRVPPGGVVRAEAVAGDGSRDEGDEGGPGPPAR